MFEKMSLKIMLCIILLGGTVPAHGASPWMRTIQSTIPTISWVRPRSILAIPTGGFVIHYGMTSRSGKVWNLTTTVDADGNMGASKNLTDGDMTIGCANSDGTATYMNLDWTDECITLEKYDLITLEPLWCQRYITADMEVMRIRDIGRTEDGGNLLSAYGGYKAKGLLIRTDSSGHPMWAKRVEANNIQHAAALSDGTIIVTGEVGKGFWMAHLDPDGGVLASGSYYLARPDDDSFDRQNTSRGNYILQLRNGLVLISGGSTWFHELPTAWVLAVTPDLDPVWLRDFTLPEFGPMLQSEDDNLIVMARRYGYIEQYEFWPPDSLISLDQHGTYRWGSTYYFSGYFQDMEMDATGHLYLFGRSEDWTLWIGQVPLHLFQGCGWLPIPDPTLHAATLTPLADVLELTTQEISAEPCQIRMIDDDLHWDSILCAIESPHLRPVEVPDD